MVGNKNILPFFAKPFPTFWLILDDFRFNVHGNGPISRPDGGIFKKVGNGSEKREKKQWCSPKLTCVLDAKFNLDYDSAIKRDLMTCFHNFMGVQR